MANEPERLWFDDTSWVDISRAFLPDAQAVYDALVDTIAWQQGRVWRYERWVEEPRLGRGFRTADIPHPDVLETQREVERRYDVTFDSVGLAYYRDNRDSVALHADDELRYVDDTVVAILTLGARRSFFVAPRRPRQPRRQPFLSDTGGATHDLLPAGGDLLVFGGRFQADWLHGVPKVSYPVKGRISAQWRWTSRRGRPVPAATNYYAPREFSRPRSRTR
jgi:alkylated DNA repair dioxygenase AlkB